MTFRPLSVAFVRRSWYSVLPILDTTGRCRVEKAVVCVAQLVAALITVHGLLSFLSHVYGLLDPSVKMLWLSVDHRIAWDQLMTWFSWVAWPVRADLLCYLNLMHDGFLWMCVVFWIPLQSCVPVVWLRTSFHFHRCRSCHNLHRELCTHIPLHLPFPVSLLDVPVHPFYTLSWHGIFPSCQESEELNTSFFWRRPLIEVETSRFSR